MEQLYFFNSKGKKDSLNKVFMVSIEKICIISLIFLLFWVLAFFLGYKRGMKVARQQARVKKTATTNIEGKKAYGSASAYDISNTASKSSPKEAVAKDKTAEFLEKEPVVGNDKGKAAKEKGKEKTAKKKTFYSIQAATYKNTRIAAWYTDKLKKEGFEAFLKEKNGFYVLYVGKFSSIEEAKRTQNILRKRFPDCLIRTLGGDTT